MQERCASITSQVDQKMALSTKKQKNIAKALTLLATGARFSDAERIRELAAKRKYNKLPASTSVWLSTVTYIRHVHTEYDTLLEEGYERDAARHFVLDKINVKLTEWRATRLLDENDNQENEQLFED